MNIEYIGRNFHLDERIREHAAEKLGKLVKFLDEPIETRVTLEIEKHRHRAEIYVTHRQGTLTATEETDGTMFDAINLAAEKMELQARRVHRRAVALHERRDRREHQALLRQRVLARERGRDHADLEVAAAAADLERLARQRGLDRLAQLRDDLARGRVDLQGH